MWSQLKTTCLHVLNRFSWLCNCEGDIRFVSFCKHVQSPVNVPKQLVTFKQQMDFDEHPVNVNERTLALNFERN